MEKVRGERCVLLKFGELALKGRNRPLFVNALERNLRRLTSDLGPLEAAVARDVAERTWLATGG